MKKYMIFYISLCVLLTFFSCTRSEKNLILVYSGLSSNRFFWSSLSGAAAKEAQKQSIKFVDLTPDSNNPELQVTAIQTAIMQDADGIIIGSEYSEELRKSLYEAQIAEIPVISLIKHLDHPHIKCHLQLDYASSAALQANYIVQTISKPGPVLILGSSKDHQEGEIIKNNVLKIFNENGIKVFQEYTSLDRKNAYYLTKQYLYKNPEIQAIFGVHDSLALSALMAAEELNLQINLQIFGFEGIPAAIKAVREGELASTVYPNAEKMGTEAIKIIKKIIKKETVPEIIQFEGIIIDKNKLLERMENL